MPIKFLVLGGGGGGVGVVWRGAEAPILFLCACDFSECCASFSAQLLSRFCPAKWKRCFRRELPEMNFIGLTFFPRKFLVEHVLCADFT